MYYYYLIPAGILLLLVFWVIAIYNGLIKRRLHVDEAWSDIEVQLKRRYDLIPNLIETVKGYAGHEKTLFENVTKARTQAMEVEKGGNPAEAAKAENMLTRALGGLMVQVEAYPDLKANQNFQSLQEDLADTEDKIQASRRFYNANTRDYNMAREVFPSSIIAGLFHFEKREFFDAEEGVEKTPEVKF